MAQHGRYTVVRKLANGGMAEIFLASQQGHEGFQKPVVLKRILGSISADPQFRSYRTWMEMMHSGVLSAAQVDSIAHYRATHFDMTLGLPGAYGYHTGVVAGFLTYGVGYGLISTIASVKRCSRTTATWHISTSVARGWRPRRASRSSRPRQRRTRPLHSSWLR